MLRVWRIEVGWAGRYIVLDQYAFKHIFNGAVHGEGALYVNGIQCSDNRGKLLSESVDISNEAATTIITNT